MKPSRDLPPEVLRKYLSYDPLTGYLTWLERAPDDFNRSRYSRARIAKGWNAKNAGVIAFTARNANGYLCGAVKSSFTFAHRAAWAIHYGETPNGFIDHINGDKADNRIANLRVVDYAENRRNCPIRKNNTSGVQGVSWLSERGKWDARIYVNSKPKLLGAFDRFEDAVAARKAAEQKYGYHQNHGREPRASAA